jgi:peptidyl-prolyl cis-trans isomerase C
VSAAAASAPAGALCGGAAPPAVNGVALAEAGEVLPAQELRRRAGVELLRQAAIAAGLLAADDPPPRHGVPSEAASEAIEAWLAGQIVLPEPDDAACRRHHAANPGRHAVGERARLRHVLFAVTPGVDVVALRQRAEATLLDLRATTPADGDRFAAVAAERSNCPSGAQGGELGWLAADDCAPEFAREVYGHPEVGVLPRLVHSRHGLHVVEVLAREPGRVPPYEAVRDAVRLALQQQAWVNAVQQALHRLAAGAELHGVDLDGGAVMASA